MQFEAAAIETARAELANLQELICNSDETDTPEKVAVLRLRVYEQYQALVALRQKSSGLQAQCHALAKDQQLLTQFESEVNEAAQREQGAEPQFDTSWLPELEDEPMDIEAGESIYSDEGKRAWRRVELEEKQRQQLFLQRMELTGTRERLIAEKLALKKRVEADSKVLSAARKAKDAIAYLEKQLTQPQPWN